MLIAEFAQVASLYPDAAEPAVTHLLWALHRVRPIIEAGDTDAAGERFRTDLAGYGGELEDLARLGVMRLFRGLERGRIAFAGELGALGMLAPEPGSLTRYVVVGPLLEVRFWARQRGIGQNTVLAVVRATDAYKLRGMPGEGVAIVRLGDRRGDPIVEDALTVLLEHGAITLSPQWRPGNVAEPGEPRLDLRPAGAGTSTARPTG